MATVANLRANLYANTAEFEKGMARAAKSLTSFNNIASTMLKGAALKAGFSALVGGLRSLTVESAKAIDQTSKMARSLGVSMKGFQALSLVAEEAGVDQNSLAGALTRTQKAVAEAANGSKGAQAAFKALGLNFKEMANMTPDKQFQLIAESLSKIQNPTQRTALAMELFGKSGRELIPMLDDLGANIEDASKYQEKFNLAISDVDGAKVEAMNDVWGRVWGSMRGLGNTIVVKVAPALTAIGRAFLDAGVDGQLFGKVVEAAVSIVLKTIDLIKASIIGLKSIFLDVSLGIDLMVMDATSGLWKLADAASQIPYIGEKMQGVKDGLLALNEGAQMTATSTLNRINQLNSEVLNYQSSLETVKALDAAAGAEMEKRLSKQQAMQKNMASFDSFGENSSKNKIQETIDNLKNESAVLQLQIDMYGQKESAIEKATRKLELQNRLIKDGATLQEIQKAGLDGYLDSLERQKNELDSIREKNELLKSTLTDISNAFLTGGKMADKFKSIAINAIQKIVDSWIKDSQRASSVSLGGGSGGGLFGGIIGGIGNFVGGLFKNFLPSFDVGSNFVPRDMTANIHRGEMIIPAKEAAQIRSGGFGGATVVQNISIGAGVSTAVRQEIARMLPELKKTTVDGVQDARMRGAIA